MTYTRSPLLLCLLATPLLGVMSSGCSEPVTQEPDLGEDIATTIMPDMATTTPTQDTGFQEDSDQTPAPADMSATCQAAHAQEVCQHYNATCGTLTEVADPNCPDRLTTITCGACTSPLDACVDYQCQLNVITPPEAITQDHGDRFGHSLAMHQDNLLVGAPDAILHTAGPHEGSPQGVAVLYQRTTSNTWEAPQILAPKDSEVLLNTSRYGYAVHIDDTYMAIGAPESKGHGVAYIYEHGSDAIYSVEGERSNMQFGAALTMHEQDLIVGAPNWSIGPISGTGRVFRYPARTSFSTSTTARGDTDGGLIGFALASSPHGLLIGAPVDPTNDINFQRSRIYLSSDINGFDLDEDAQLISTELSDPVARNYRSITGMGYSLSTEEDIIIAGAPYMTPRNGDTSQDKHGGVFVFHIVENQERPTLSQVLYDTTRGDDRFGHAVAIHDNIVAVGAPGAHDDAGVVELYTLDPTTYTLTHLATINAPEEGRLRFGSSVLFDREHTHLFIGAPGPHFDEEGDTHGRVYTLDISRL